MHILPPPAPPAPPPSARRAYALLALAFAAFAVYGSLVPLNFAPVPLEEAIRRFSRIRYLSLGVASRADFVANILLFIPLGFLVMGALRADRRGALGTLLTAIPLAAALSCLSLSIEFTQVFFPQRTVSVNDIVAETAGGLVGILTWLLVGPGLTEWARGIARARDRRTLAEHLLLGYAVALFVAQLMPLDLTISPGEIAEKVREGRIALFYRHASFGHAAADFLGDVALYAPVGALAAIGWASGSARGRRHPVHALLLGTAFVIAVEVAQLFVFSRYSDLFDLAVGALGVSLGIALARFLPEPASPGAPSAARAPAHAAPSSDVSLAPAPSLRRLPALGAALAAVLLLAFHWYPYDFTLDRELVRRRLPALFAPPFSHYYMGTEFHAFTELTRKLLYALPLGVLLELTGRPRDPRPGVARLRRTLLLLAAASVFAVCEAGQLLLPGRVPDITDVVIGTSSALAGMLLASALRPRAPSRAAP